MLLFTVGAMFGATLGVVVFSAVVVGSRADDYNK